MRYYLEVSPGVVAVRRQGIKLPRAAQQVLRLGGGRREKVREFSWDARKRMLRALGSVRWEDVTGRMAMVTLTYPGEYPRTGKEIKSHLAKFRKRWEREYGPVRAFWGLEFQSENRRAPHFHLYVEMPEGEPGVIERVLGQAWWEVVGSEDSRHLVRGCHVRWGVLTGKRRIDVGTADERELRRENAGDIARYMWGHAAKWKQKQLPDDFDDPGRWWGLWNLEQVTHTVEVSREAYEQLRGRVLGEQERRRGQRAAPSKRLDGMDGLWTVTPDGLTLGVAWLREVGGDV